ncbi:MAG: hypothetical protein BAA02_03015 [Paenibacillaceae bacterium ZCTH02-B3]|nr:MAG: hypothetical protein BAA02_03015 [Paenibacillaceae bacterium ZCTH02-B3]
METNHNFQGNLTGLIDLLSNHLYSNPGVFVRELLQNAMDAITARKRLGHRFDPRIHVETFSNHTISVQDNGIGLTRDEIIRFLASIGSTAKKDPDGADDFIGQFGIGLLSCFVVSDEIVLVTRSALDGDSLEWKGRPDGTYRIRKLDHEVPIGTTVYLKAKPEYEELFEYWQLKGLLQKYGKYLDVRLTLLDEGFEEILSKERVPWKLSGEEAVKFVEGETGSRPLDIIPLSSTLGGLEGFAAILPYTVNVQKRYFKRIAAENRELFEKILSIHYQSIKLVANEDSELYELFIPYLKFETSYGEMEMSAIAGQVDTLYVTATVDEFRQIARVAKAQQILVVNGGYQYDFGLLMKASEVWEQLKVEVLDVMKFAGRFTPLPPREREETRDFLEMANDFLAGCHCVGTIRYFEPADLPVLYITNNDLNYWKIVNDTMQAVDSFFADLLAAVKAEYAEEPLSRLCFNYNNPMIRKIVACRDERLQRRAIELLYTQSLLMGNHVMSNRELQLMNESLFYFVNLGLDRAEAGEHRG